MKFLLSKVMVIVAFATSIQSLRLSMVTPSSPKQSAQLTVSRSIKAAAIIASSVATSVSAKTYFDTDVYGDKELKIATVNKLKQKLRNAILQDVTVAPGLIQLAINDALGYDASTDDGGPDGSIQFEMNRVENQGLEKAFKVIEEVKNSMQRTNTLSFADVCAFGGAEALETIGCGRIPVQVGRFDAKKANSKSTIINWSNPSSEGIVSAFQTSGLDYKEVALLFGGLGEIQRVVAETLATSGGDDEEEDDEFEKQPFVPTTFGARDAIYGSKMGKGDFGSNYLKSILSNKPPASDVIGKQLAADPKVKSYLAKYATNEPAFKQEIGEAYVKLTLLGSAYTTRNS